MNAAPARMTDAIIPAQVLISLLRLAEQKLLEPESLLRGSRLFINDLACPDAKVSPQQCLLVIKKLRRELNQAAHLGAEWGQRLCNEDGLIWFELWRHASHLDQGLNLWRRFYPLFQPLLQLRVEQRGEHLHLRLCNAVTLGSQEKFLFEAALAALRQLLLEQLGTDLWMRIEVPWPQRSDDFESQTYLGTNIRFDAPCCCLVLGAAVRYRPFGEQSDFRRRLILQNAKQLMGSLEKRELLQAKLRRWVRRNLHKPVCLDEAAAFLDISPATLKRRLKEEGTQFKALLDEVRSAETLHLMNCEQLNNRELAKRMAFSDEQSFRRAFKRWTGTIPSHYRCY